MKISTFLLMLSLFLSIPLFSQKKKNKGDQVQPSVSSQFQGLKFRNIGPFRGGRSVASAGVPGDPLTYYMGTCGGGLWKTSDAGTTWINISDGFFQTGSVGAIAIAPSDPNVLYVGMGEHPVRGVMTTHGDGIYKSLDAGKTWSHVGLPNSMHIAEIRVHPRDPDMAYVAVQGSLYGPSEQRGIYKTTNGGESWDRVFFINNTTGAADLSMDDSNPRILYAGMWDHQRTPWQIRSGGAGSGIFKSVDSGASWNELKTGLPESMGKTAVDVSPANPSVLYANIEAEGEQAGVYASRDGGNTWKQTTKDRITIARAWYYIEIFADPMDEHTVYVLNAPMLKSIDGGKTFKSISNPHGDQHHMWINPDNADNIILSNDGGACVTFNGGQTWSSQQNQPTCQFYRVITDNRFPYHIYAGQQDNSTICTPGRTNGSGIGWKDWYIVSGCESAFLAFDPDDPEEVFGTCIQGFIDVYDHETKDSRGVMAHPHVGLGMTPSEMKYRYNWNNPVVSSPQNPKMVFHGGNKVLRTQDGGLSWEEISPDLTRNEVDKQGLGGFPFTNEAAGGEVYNTISYLEASEHDENVLWVGSDCGLVHLTRDGGANWTNVTPKGLKECLVNAIDVSPHDPARAYITTTRYKFNENQPGVFYTDNYGSSWTRINNGFPNDNIVRVVREDRKVKGLLYAGTEQGLYISFNNGSNWEKFQLNLPECPITDFTFQDNDLVVATMGRSFWILDDLSAIQQSEGKFSNSAHIYTPKPSYKYFGGGRMRPGTVIGQNPAQGVIFDYYLPENVDTNLVLIEILNNKGDLVRTYRSKKKKDSPKNFKAIPAKNGVNRFNWDMRREQLPAIKDVMILGGLQGIRVSPGEYTIQLKYKDQVVKSMATIMPDPRLNARAQDYEEQERNLLELESTAQNIHDSVNESREIKSRLDHTINSLKDIDGAGDLLKSGTEIKEKLNSWEERLIQPKQKTFQDVINFPNKLAAEIVSLMQNMSSSDPRITKGAMDMKTDVMGKWMGLKKEREQIMQSLNIFNTNYREQNIPVIIVPRTKVKTTP